MANVVDRMAKNVIGKWNVAMISLICLTLFSASISGALATAGNLPGGTSIEVIIDTPFDGEINEIPIGETTIDVEIEGTASVGAAVPVKDTAVVYIVDRSGSMTGDADVDCDGDTIDDTRLLCEQAAVKAANAAASSVLSAVGETGLGSFATSGTAHDVDVAGGVQLIVAPPGDVDNQVDSLVASGATCYFCGLQAADDILAESTSTFNLVLFLSDGLNNVGADVTTFVPANFGSNTVIKAFFLGSDGDCTTDASGLGSLDEVVALSTAAGGSCTQITDFSDLAAEIQSAIGSTLVSVDVTVDGSPVAVTTSDVLPKNGGFDPKNIDYEATAEDLGPGTYEICAIATGSDVGGTDSVTECVEKIVIQLVGLDIKPGSFPNSINTNNNGKIPVALLGSATFDVSEVDTTTLEFGPGGASPVQTATSDVNGDGFLDLVSHYITQETGITPGLTEACLTGELTDGTLFKACDSVRTVPAA
ncbi:MAG: hypothetical protein ACREBU_01350 [Nitrososphaera sp.]